MGALFKFRIDLNF